MKYFYFFKTTCLVMALLGFTLNFSSCSDDDDELVVTPGITLTSEENSLTFDWQKCEGKITFTATTAWTANVDGDWIKLPYTEGAGGEIAMPFLVYENNSEFGRDATLNLVCGDKTITVTVHQNQNPDAVKYIDPKDIRDYDKYIIPREWNPGFEKGAAHMLRDDAKWSWHRHAQSEHFFVFWEPGFGADPNSSDVPAALRVDINDLLAKAEEFYKTNIETLKMVEVGGNKSNLDKYKMQIYLLYQEEWLATGSGYDDMIGALWVNPSTCKPVGSTIAHEIGHSFQFQVAADKLMRNEIGYTANGMPEGGFRYGYGPDGAGGNGFWEQCAQWQAYQSYPEEAFTSYHIDVWLANYHRHFSHEWMRYESYWFQYYWAMKHGINAVGKIWNEAKYPEDPLMAYQRIFCNGDQNTLYADLYDYAARMITYDLDGVRDYKTDAAMKYKTTLFDADDNFYQVGYASCPGTSGFNIIELNVPETEGTTVKAIFEGLASGSALAEEDPGNVLDVDGKTVNNTTSYNKTDDSGNWRYGFVAVADGKAQYSEMFSGKSGEATYTVPTGTSKLYMVVLAAPDNYAPHPWDDDETNDAQWPYKVKFEGTGVFGMFNIDITKEPADITLTYNLNCDAAYEDWQVGSIDLSGNPDLAQAFVMKPNVMEGNLLQVGQKPEEGKIAIQLLQPDGTYETEGSANNGFWCDKDGNKINWGDDAYTFVEFAGLTLNYGLFPGHPVAGETYTMKPVLVYTKDGKQYKVTIVINMQF